MTDIDAEAVALVNEVRIENGLPPFRNLGLIDDYTAHEALCRAIEQHKATMKERDDLATALKATAAACADHVNTILQLRSELAGYKQEVSDIVCDYSNNVAGFGYEWGKLISLIIPKSDPLMEVIEVLRQLPDDTSSADIIIALEARGLKIVEKGL